MKFIFEKLLKGDNSIEFEFKGQKVTGKIKEINLERECLIVAFDTPFKHTVTKYVPCMFSMDEDATCPEEVEEYLRQCTVYIH